VLETGEYDYAWNLLVEDDVLKRMERSGKGRVVVAGGGGDCAHADLFGCWRRPDRAARTSLTLILPPEALLDEYPPVR